MIRDFEAGLGEGLITADCCLVGAGAAGITIASHLAGSGLRVVTLEAGGLESEEVSQALYRGENRGLPRRPFEATRLRFFGGSTNHWTGLCGPLEPRDLQARRWIPHSGWPIAYAELARYYPRAWEWVGLDAGRVNLDHETAIGRELPKIAPEKLQSGLLHYSPAIRFGSAFRETLEADRDHDVILHANATHIQVDAEARRVEHIDFRTLNGLTGRVRARAYVLCCGGLENARLLLLSRDVEKNGIGNRRDTVGRFLTDHIFVTTGEVVQTGEVDLDELYVDFERAGAHYRPAFELSEELEREHELARGAAYFWRSDDHRSEATRAARRVYEAFRRAEFPEDLGHDALAIARDLSGLLGDFTSDEPEQPPRPRLEVRALLDQTPNRESRITLSGERDALGLPRIAVNWRLRESDRRTLLLLTETVAAELGRLGLGRVRMAHWLDEHDGWPSHPMDYNHPMGATRMSRDPAEGVVDSDARVHGTENLYIAGSSIFPTGGVVNPTLTIVALSMRLADHLRDSLD
jgi:choline dehydrogenase-like flavoprotein